jgi:sugar lactone lactonase YvrE
MDTYADGGAFFECPRWYDGRLWVSDYWRGQVLAIGPDEAAETVAEVPTSPSGLGWLPDGTPLVVSMMDTKVLRMTGGVHADLAPYAGPQANDMVVDATGRAYVSTIDFMDFEEMKPTNLVRVDPDGTVSVAAEGLSFPNGSAITPDGTTLIVAESWAQKLTAFDIAPDGSLSGRRDWATFSGDGQWACAPDGIALDAEGALWVADAANKRAVRVREGGEILQEIGTGDQDVVAVALGGTDGRTLFLCVTPDHGLMPDEAVRTRPARILTCPVDVPASGR